MGRLITPIEPLDELGQHTYWKLREKTRQRRNLVSGLFRTHLLGPAPQNFVTATLFPSSTVPPTLERPCTFVVDVLITGASADGVVIEMGSSTHGMAITLGAGVIYGAAGGAGAEVANGAHATFTPGVGRRLQVGLAVIPGPGVGTVYLFIDGKLVSKVQSTSTNFTGNAIADVLSDGAIAQVNGTLTGRVPAVTVPTNFQIVSPVSIYVGQIPRHIT